MLCLHAPSALQLSVSAFGAQAAAHIPAAIYLFYCVEPALDFLPPSCLVICGSTVAARVGDEQ